MFVRVAEMMQKNQPIKQGMTIEGLGNVNVDEANHTIIGNNTESLDKANLPKLIKLGL